MKGLFVFPMLVAVVVLTAACNLGKKPEMYRSESGGFSVMIPGKPDESTQALDTPRGKIDLHLFTVQKGNRAYIVSYSDYPEEMVKQNSPQKSLDGSRDGEVRNMGKLILEKNLSLDGHPGRELVIEGKTSDGHEATSKTRIFLVGNRLYQVIFAAPRGEVSSSEMDDFLESFKLTPKT